MFPQVLKPPIFKGFFTETGLKRHFKTSMVTFSFSLLRTGARLPVFLLSCIHLTYDLLLKHRQHLVTAQSCLRKKEEIYTSWLYIINTMWIKSDFKWMYGLLQYKSLSIISLLCTLTLRVLCFKSIIQSFSLIIHF